MSNSGTRTETSSSTTTPDGAAASARVTWVRATAWAVALVLGFIQTWRSRHAMNADGVSYLDIADAYLASDWPAAINAYWSPLYSWLLGGTLTVVRPSPYWEFTVAHFVTFGIYVVSLGTFELLLTEIIRARRDHAPGDDEFTGPGAEWAWRVLGYSLFLWSALGMIGLTWVTPDMAVAALAYLAGAILLRLRDPHAPGWLPGILGVTLGLGYLTKAAILPLSLVFLASGLVAWGLPRRLAIRRVFLAMAALALVASPYIVALSVAKGRPTWGVVGKLIYAWCVEKVANTSACDGESENASTPVHATRQISEGPAIYEFATPIAGTYPPWYDPSYWYEGESLRLSARKMLGRLAFHVVKWWPTVAPLIAVFGVLWWVSARSAIIGAKMRPFAPLTVPSAAALLMYGLVHVEPRYIGPFVVLLTLGGLAGLPLPPLGIGRIILQGGAIGLAVSLAAPLCAGLLLNALALVRRPDLSGPSTHVQWEVARALHEVGVRPTDPVASIGGEMSPAWARLARVRVVAQMPAAEANGFWVSDPATQAQVTELFAGTGARAIVTNVRPHWARGDRWHPLDGTGYHVFALHP